MELNLGFISHATISYWYNEVLIHTTKPINLSTEHGRLILATLSNINIGQIISVPASKSFGSTQYKVQGKCKMINHDHFDRILKIDVDLDEENYQKLQSCLH